MHRSSPYRRASRLADGASTLRRVATIGLLAVAACLATAPAGAVTIDWVTVGDPGNTADGNGYGAVAYGYRIGKYEITIGQYAAFLNAVAASDPYQLYDEQMETDLVIAGISRSGEAGSYSYSVMTVSGSAPYGGVSNANRPITYVTWFDAARFANWMHNGQGASSTETGAYTLVDGQTGGTAPARNPGAQFYIPTENEWYKAAYYKGGNANAGYWAFPTQSDDIPGNTIGSGANQANYFAGGSYPNGTFAVTQSASYSTSQNYLSDVGTFSGSPSAYGTFDQAANVFEWNDLTGTAGQMRGVRGGSWGHEWYRLSKDDSTDSNSDTEAFYNTVGFRLASPVAPVPEPSTWVMAAGGLACAAWGAVRRRTRR